MQRHRSYGPWKPHRLRQTDSTLKGNCLEGPQMRNGRAHPKERKRPRIDSIPMGNCLEPTQRLAPGGPPFGMHPLRDGSSIRSSRD